MTIPKETRLENAAIIYPSCRTRKYATMFRLSVTMDDPVNPDILNQALQATMERFPSFRYTLRNGAFWWYLRLLNHQPGVRKTQPFLPFSFRSNGGYLFKLGYEGDTINLDIFHALTDGTGGMTFLLSLAAEYARLRYGSRIDSLTSFSAVDNGVSGGTTGFDAVGGETDVPFHVRVNFNRNNDAFSMQRTFLLIFLNVSYNILPIEFQVSNTG